MQGSYQEHEQHDPSLTEAEPERQPSAEVRSPKAGHMSETRGGSCRPPPPPGLTKCPFKGCTCTYVKEHNMSAHMRMHTGERPYICLVKGCGKMFSRRSFLRNHSWAHRKPYKCSFEGCSKNFARRSDLKSHLKIHENRKATDGEVGPTADEFCTCMCDACGLRFVTEPNLNRHIRERHKTQFASEVSPNRPSKLQELRGSTDGNTINAEPGSKSNRVEAFEVLESGDLIPGAQIEGLQNIEDGGKTSRSIEFSLVNNGHSEIERESFVDEAFLRSLSRAILYESFTCRVFDGVPSHSVVLSNEDCKTVLILDRACWIDNIQIINSLLLPVSVSFGRSHLKAKELVEKCCFADDDEKLFSFMLKMILGLPQTREDSSAAAIACGLAGVPNAHIDISRLLKETLTHNKEITQTLKELFFAIRCNGHDSSSAPSSCATSEEAQSTTITLCHRMLVKTIICLKTFVEPELCNNLRCVTQSVPGEIFELAKLLHENKEVPKSVYLGVKYFPSERILRILHIPRVRVKGLRECRNGSLAVHSELILDDKVIYIDVGEGCKLSEIRDHAAQQGLSSSKLLQDLAPYLDRTTEYGCWIPSACKETIRPLIVVDEPVLITLPHSELKSVEWANQGAREDAAIFHVRGKLKDLQFADSSPMNVDRIAVMVGWLGKIALSLARGARRRSSYTPRERKPLWNEWFRGLKLRELGGKLFFINVREWESLVARKSQQVAGSLKMSAFGFGAGGGASLALSESNIPDHLFSTLKLARSEEWTSREQLSDLYDEHGMWYPDQWESKDPMHLRNTRIWQFLQLAAIKLGVSYVGERCDGLYSNPGKKYQILNNTAVKMHHLGSLLGRECRWELKGSEFKIQGLLELDESYDMRFTASYLIGRIALCLNNGIALNCTRRLGKMQEPPYRGWMGKLLESMTATAVELEPEEKGDPTDSYEDVVVCGAWGQGRSRTTIDIAEKSLLNFYSIAGRIG